MFGPLHFLGEDGQMSIVRRLGSDNLQLGVSIKMRDETSARVIKVHMSALVDQNFSWEEMETENLRTVQRRKQRYAEQDLMIQSCSKSSNLH